MGCVNWRWSRAEDVDGRTDVGPIVDPRAGTGWHLYASMTAGYDRAIRIRMWQFGSWPKHGTPGSIMEKIPIKKEIERIIDVFRRIIIG